MNDRKLEGEAQSRKDLIEEVNQSLSVIAHTLVNNLDQINEPFVLVFDDYHRIHSVQVHRLMDELLRFPLQQLHLVIITRNDNLELLLEAFKKNRQVKAASPNAKRRATSTYEQNLLSDRELEILRLVAEGYRNHEIAGRLFLSLNTIKKYLYHAYQKLDVNNRMNAVKKARELGMIEEE